jgi:hypothetical protein
MIDMAKTKLALNEFDQQELILGANLIANGSVGKCLIRNEQEIVSSVLGLKTLKSYEYLRIMRSSPQEEDGDFSLFCIAMALTMPEDMAK